MPEPFPFGEPAVHHTCIPTCIWLQWFDDAYVHVRRAHAEDWAARVTANHLFAGADAFVSAKLCGTCLRSSGCTCCTTALSCPHRCDGAR